MAELDEAKQNQIMKAGSNSTDKNIFFERYPSWLKGWGTNLHSHLSNLSFTIRSSAVSLEEGERGLGDCFVQFQMDVADTRV